MALTGPDKKRLQKALLDAFRNKSALAQMLFFELDEQLDAIAHGENLSEIVFKVISWAEASGREADLIAGATERNPGNALLQDFAVSVRDRISRSNIVEQGNVGTHPARSDSSRADVRVQLRGAARSAKFYVENWDKGVARNVNVTATSKRSGDSPFVQGDYDQKLPIPELLPGDKVTLLAAVTMQSGTTFNVITTWIDPNGAERKREQQVSLM